MSLSTPILLQSQRTAWVVVMGVVFGLGAPALLNWIATPGRMAARLSALEAEADRIQAVRDTPGDEKAYGPGAICTRSAGQEAAALQGDLTRLAQRLRLARLEVSVAPDAPEPTVGRGSDDRGADVARRLQPVAFRVEGPADYAESVRLLAGLAGHAPAMRLDRVDMIAQGAFVRLHIEGRVWCEPSAIS